MSKRYLMWTLTTFVVTLFICTFLSLEWSLIGALAVLLLLIPTAFIRFRLKRLLLPCQVALIAAMMLFAGLQYNIQKTEQQLLDQTVDITGVVTDLSTNSAGNLKRYEVQLTSIGGEELPFYRQFKIYLYSDTSEEHLPGTKLSGTVEFFETATEYGLGRENRVLLSSFSSADAMPSALEDQDSLYRVFYDFRTAIRNRIAFGKQETQGLLRSVCFGDTDTLEPGLKVSLRRIGLSHITSVSGFHLTFAVLFLGYIFILLGIHYRIRYILNIFVALFFTAMVGFPVSCIRACIMLIILNLGMALDLFPDALTSLSVAAFLIVLVNPLAVRDVSFLLSVTATAGILLLSSPIENFLFPKKISKNHVVNQVYRKLTGIFACSVAATLATLPIVIVVFDAVSLISPLANVVLMIPLEFFFVLGILMAMLGWIPGIGSALGFLCDLLYRLIDSVSGLFGRFSFASVSGVNWAGIVILVLLVGILGVAVYDFLKYQHRSFMALFLLLLCFSGCFISIYRAAHPSREVEIAFIDVGQGDCTVISRDHRAVIIDYGGSSERRYNLINYLRKRNIYEVELLAFTHLHSDHTNGLRTLLNYAYVDQIRYPELEIDSAELSGLIQSQNYGIITNDETVTVLDDVQLSVITEAAFDAALIHENERCVCYRVTYGGTSVLITGDLEGDAEMKLLDQQLNCSILKVAHHGSDTSSMYSFIKAASPEVAVISVGENSYGLPSESVIERLKTVCPLVLQTSGGNVVFRTDGKTMERVSS